MALDPRTCLADFVQTGRNFGRRPPSLSLRNVQRDIRSARTTIENIGTRIEGAIGAATRGEFLPGQLLSVGNELRCPPTAYANYFSQHRPPKFKFMFFASLELNQDFIQAFGQPWGEGEVWWFIKQSGRPNVTYEYEDVNMYNFRQKVLRRATLEPISIQMYDDMQDVSHSFWNTFLRIQNPVTNILTQSVLLEENGMNWYAENATKNDLQVIRSANGEQSDTPPTMANPARANVDSLTADEINALPPEERRRQADIFFSEPRIVPTGDSPPIVTLQNSASTGVLPGNGDKGIPPFKQIIKSIKLHHIIDWGQKMVVYDFVNPRINEIRLDELTWESSEPSVIDVTFEYDTFQIYYPVGVDETSAENPKTPPAYGINVHANDVSPGNIGKAVANLPIPGL